MGGGQLSKFESKKIFNLLVAMNRQQQQQNCERPRGVTRFFSGVVTGMSVVTSIFVSKPNFNVKQVVNLMKITFDNETSLASTTSPERNLPVDAFDKMKEISMDNITEQLLTNNAALVIRRM